MTDRKGTIKVETTDILPIIKKWLYSEHDIFIRELVANATDAITKRATIARGLNQEIPTGKILVSLNKENKTITDFEGKKLMIVSFLEGKAKKNLSPSNSVSVL